MRMTLGWRWPGENKLSPSEESRVPATNSPLSYLITAPSQFPLVLNARKLRHGASEIVRSDTNENVEGRGKHVFDQAAR